MVRVDGTYINFAYVGSNPTQFFSKFKPFQNIFLNFFLDKATEKGMKGPTKWLILRKYFKNSGSHGGARTHDLASEFL